MNMTMAVILSTVGGLLLLFGTIYAGLYLGKKSVEKKRAQMDQDRPNKEEK